MTLFEEFEKRRINFENCVEVLDNIVCKNDNDVKHVEERKNNIIQALQLIKNIQEKLKE